MKKLFLTFCLVLLMPVFAQAQVYKDFDSNFQVGLPDDWKINMKMAEAAKTQFYAISDSGKILLFIEKLDLPDFWANSFADYPQDKKDAFADFTVAEIVKGNANAWINYKGFINVLGEPVLVVQSQDNSSYNVTATLIQVTFLRDFVFYRLSFLTEDYDDSDKEQIEYVLKNFKKLY